MTPTSEEFYEKGYCLRQYDINNNIILFRYKNEDFRIPAGSVPLKLVKEIFPEATGMMSSCSVAHIDDVRKAHEQYVS